MCFNIIRFNNKEPLSTFKKLFQNFLFNNEAAKNRSVEYSADICADVSSDVPSDAESGNNINDGGSEVDFTRNRSTRPLRMLQPVSEEDDEDLSVSYIFTMCIDLTYNIDY